ncbi:hypothetical protein [Tessaracoccus sp. G1721]
MVAGFVRSLLALLLMSAGVMSALGGVAAQWLDTTARTSEPMRVIVGPVASDPRVLGAIAVELTAAVVEQLPPVVDRIPGVRDQVEELVTLAMNQIAGSEGFNQAWEESIDLSRADFVAGLDLMRSGGDAPTLWLTLDPFVELGMSRLVEISPEILRPYVTQIPMSGDLRVALGRPDTVQAGYAADALSLARHWIWFYAAAAALAVIGLAVGSWRGRWVAWILAVAGGLAGLTFARGLLAERAAAAGGDSLQAVVQAALVDGATSSLLTWTAPAVTTGWVLLVLGGVALVVAWVWRPRSR